MGHMSWCCFWNTVYDGTIASAVHMLTSTLLYIGMCFGICSFALLYGGPSSTEMAADYRELRLRHHFQHFHSDKTAEMGMAEDHELDDKITNFEFRRREFIRPLLSPLERDLYIYSSLAMIGVNVPIFITSLLLIIAAVMKKPKLMFIWVVSMIPYLVLDTIYHSFLFYTLLGFTDLDALQTLLWFQLWTVTIIMFWVFRCAFDVYAILCVMAYRNELLTTVSSVAKVRQIPDSESAVAEAKMLKKSKTPVHDKVGSTLSAIAKAGLSPTVSLFQSGLIAQTPEQFQKLDALHNAAATADIQQQLVLMSAAQHLATTSGLLPPSTAGVSVENISRSSRPPTSMSRVSPSNLIDLSNSVTPSSTTANLAGHGNSGAGERGPIRDTSSQGLASESQTGISNAPRNSVGNLADRANSVDQASQGRIGSSQVNLPEQASQGGIGSSQINLAHKVNQSAMSAQPSRHHSLATIATAWPGRRNTTAGWGMSKHLLKQQQQVLAIATGLQKSGLLKPHMPLAAVVKELQDSKDQLSPLKATPSSAMLASFEAASLSSNSKQYTKLWLRMAGPNGIDDFSRKELV